jgi:nitrile hydratase
MAYLPMSMIRGQARADGGSYDAYTPINGSARNAASAAAELGIATSNYASAVSTHPNRVAPSLPVFGHGHTELRVVENTPETHNLVVCTLCSCYPRMLLGMPPAWYKSRAYRSRLVREPRAVLREFGTEFADDVAVRVHDSTADLRYVVLPMRPEGSEGMSEAELAALVTRDSMVGVTVLKPVAR